MLRALCLTAVAAAIATPALAAGPLVLTSKVLVESKRRAADGSTTIALTPARKVVPNDRVQFVIAYRNTGAQPLANIVLDNPVPAGLGYRAPASGSPAPDLSVDGVTYGALADLRVKAATGPRPATTDDITHVRWRLARPLTAGAQGQFAYQAVLK